MPVHRRDPAHGYDRLAHAYPYLEAATFGPYLHRARCAHLARIPPHARVLTLGEGDGRFAATVLRRVPDARVVAVDVSEAMLRAAERRAPLRADASFLRADLSTYRPSAASFDVVACLFALDQFPSPTLERMLPRLTAALRPGGSWLHADFAPPAPGLRGVPQRVLLGGLYRAFRLLTGIEARRLPPIHAHLAGVGLRPAERRTFLCGAIETGVYTRPPK